MFARLFRRDTQTRSIASALYGAIVAQARNPVLYAKLGVPDTVDGRFEMVVLHTVVFLDRLHREGETGKAIGQRIFDLHCADMDRSLRELGIGDLGVPKRMKKMAEGFYGRAGAYGAAIAANDEAGLAAAIARNVFRGAESTTAATALSAYVLASAKRMAVGPALAEPPAFADPAAFVRTGVSA